MTSILTAFLIMALPELSLWEGVANPKGRIIHCGNNAAAIHDWPVGGAVGAPGSASNPVSTFSAALALATTNRGDTILIHAGHAETIGVTGSSVTIDENDVTIIGLGTGYQRPVFTVEDPNDANDLAITLNVTGNGVVVKNLRFVAGLDDIADAITVTGDGCAFIGNSFEATGTSDQAQTYMLLNGALDTIVSGNVFYGADDVCDQAIDIAAASSRTIIEGNTFLGSFSVAGVAVTAGATTDLIIRENDFMNAVATAHAVEVQDALSCTGLITRNHCVADGAALSDTLPIDTGGAQLGASENWATDGVADVTAVKAPATGT